MLDWAENIARQDKENEQKQQSGQADSNQQAGPIGVSGINQESRNFELKLSSFYPVERRSEYGEEAERLLIHVSLYATRANKFTEEALPCT